MIMHSNYINRLYHIFLSQNSYISMEDITEEQYQKVLQYMQANPNLEYLQASQIMAKFGYNLQRANQQALNAQNRDVNVPMEMMGEQYDNQDDQQLDKMQKYLLKRSQNKSKGIKLLTRSKQCISKLCLHYTEKLIPQLIKRKIIRSQFYKIYQDQATIQLCNRTLEDARQKYKINNKKAMLIIISDEGKNHCIVEFLKKKKTLHFLEENFEVFGTNENQLSKYPEIANQRAPSVLIVRENQVQELKIVQKYYNQKQILSIDRTKVEKAIQEIKQSEKKQRQKMRRANEKIHDVSKSRVSINTANQSQIYQDDQQEEEEDNMATYLKNKRQSKLIKTQNKQYEEMISKKKIEEALQAERQRKMDQIRQERQARKMSIPDQPLQIINDNEIIEISFRCPNGQTINHKFSKSQKCELIFNWVDLNEEIYFEDDQYNEQGMRKFDLLYSYPPQSLKQKLDSKISSIFQDEKVKIVIKEL